MLPDRETSTVGWSRGRSTALVCGLASLALPAQAEIAVSPLRQVITVQAPVATYEVSNPSRRIVEGRISWLDLTATETGFRAAEPSERAARSAAPYLTIAPAAFRLEPGARTTVSIRLNREIAALKGERRSHLLIETAALRTPLRRAGGSLQADIGIGVSTPVILRAAEKPAAAARFGATRLLRTSAGLLELETYIHPEGPVSAYGGIAIWLPAPDGKAKLLARLDNVAAYAEAERRRFTVPLNVSRLPAGALDVVFDGAAEFAGIRFAERRFEIAPAP